MPKRIILPAQAPVKNTGNCFDLVQRFVCTQVTPDGDYTQTGVQWNKVGFPNPQHKQYIQVPYIILCYIL
jgi:hypothetical protein